MDVRCMEHGGQAPPPVTQRPAPTQEGHNTQWQSMWTPRSPLLVPGWPPSPSASSAWVPRPTPSPPEWAPCRCHPSPAHHQPHRHSRSGRSLSNHRTHPHSSRAVPTFTLTSTSPFSSVWILLICSSVSVATALMFPAPDPNTQARHTSCPRDRSSGSQLSMAGRSLTFASLDEVDLHALA